MGRLVLQQTHSYQGKNFDAHVNSIQKRLAKVISRERVYFTVIFVGETHNTIDERRRALIFGFRPSAPSLLTVVERGMGVPDRAPRLVVESSLDATKYTSSDPRRDDEVVNKIAAACRVDSLIQTVLILFGEDHEQKIRERLIASNDIPAMVWHFYPSYNDHAVLTQIVFPTDDPRNPNYTIVGMARVEGTIKKIDVMQLAERVMPSANNYRLAIKSPWVDNWDSEFAVFARDPLLTTIQHSLPLNGQTDAYVDISANDLLNLRVINIGGHVRPVPNDLKHIKSRREMISEFWG